MDVKVKHTLLFRSKQWVNSMKRCSLYNFWCHRDQITTVFNFDIHWMLYSTEDVAKIYKNNNLSNRPQPNSPVSNDCNKFPLIQLQVLVAGQFWVFLFLTVWGMYILFISFILCGSLIIKFWETVLCGNVISIVKEPVFEKQFETKAIRNFYCVTRRARNLPPSKFSELCTCVSTHERNCSSTRSSDALDKTQDG